MMLAAIDAGSNTLRLLIGKVEESKIVPHIYRRHICRLAGGFSESDGLADAAKKRTLEVFHSFSELCNTLSVSKVEAVGTAAFRQAVNGESFARQVRDETGLPLSVIDGDREALYTARGVLSVLEPAPDHALIIDIGGGSTELVFCCRGRVQWTHSYPLGVVRMVEKEPTHASRSKAVATLVATAGEDFKRQCAFAGVKPDQVSLVGTAGTVTTLAALDMQMDSYDWQRVNNYTMPVAALQYWHARLGPMSPGEREALPGMEKGRGDLILAGLEIVLALMQNLDSGSLTASDFGLLEGLLLCISEGRKS